MNVLFALLLVTGIDTARADVDGVTGSLFYIDSNDGLPQNSVRALLVDHYNFVWVGTERGLARYDGHRFVNFSETLDDVPTDVLVSVHEDSHGRLWTNWFKSNPRLISADRGTVVELTPAFPDDNLVEQLDQIYEDPTGRVWFSGLRSINSIAPDGTLQALRTPGKTAAFTQGTGRFVYAGGTGGLYYVDTSATDPRVAFLDLSNDVAPGPGAGQDVQGLLEWNGQVVSCTRWGVHLIGETPETLDRLFHSPGLEVGECRLLGDTLVFTLQPPGSYAFPLAAYDLSSRVQQPLPAGLPSSGYLSHAHVDRAGNQWIVVAGEVYRRAAGKDRFDLVDLRAPLFGVMTTVTESRGGEIWIGTDGAGLAVFAPHRNKFQTVVPPDPGTELASPQVRGIGVGRYGDVWLATDERGIARWNRETGEWRQYRASSGPFRELVVLEDGSVWVGDGPGQQVLRYDPADDRFAGIIELPANYVKLAPGPDGRLLLASGPVLQSYDPATGELRRLNERDLPGRVRAMTLGPDGNIWLGIHQYGLSRLAPDGSEHRWTRANSGLTSDQPFALSFGPGGALWIGTWHGGLLRFDPRSETFEHWGSSNGLPDDTVFGIAHDDAGDLWLSTYRGLVRFTPCTGDGCRPEIHVFNRFDGLQGDEFDADSFHRAADGELFFGGGGGLNAFHPQEIELNDHAPELKLTRASLNGGPLPGRASVFDPAGTLELPAGFGELRIELSSMDYNAPARNRYRFRDLAHDPGWVELEGPELTLRGLTEGRHTLEFRGSNNDGLWSEQPVRLDIDINPPWYRSAIMLVLYGAVLLLAPILYYQWRQARLVAARHRLQEQVAARTRDLERASSARERFFANVSHEIAAPLHMILLMLEQNRGQEGCGGRLYTSATGYAAQLLAYLRHLVEGARSLEGDSNPYRVELASVIQTLVDINRPVAGGRQISVLVGDLPPGWVKVFRHSPASIFSNLLVNSLTYTPQGGDVLIEGERLEGCYRVTISNSLHPEHAVELQRAPVRGVRGAFDATAFGGHGLGLSIVTESVESLGGSMHQDVTPEKRIRFCIELPLASSDLPELPVLQGMEFSLEQLLAIERLTENAADGAMIDDAQQAPSLRTVFKRVLVVEDDTKVATLMRDGLRPHFQVRVTGNCQDAIKVARDWLPDAILCDLFLPDAPGFDVVRAVRNNRMTQDALVLMVSASISETDREQGIDAGVDQFIRKPVSLETLRLIINNHFDLARQRQEGQRSAELRRRALQENGAPLGEAFGPAMDRALSELYDDPSTTIEDFQTRLSLSYPALVRHCRQHFGTTPKRLLVLRRIAEAKKMLTHTELKIGLVAELCGFSSHAQFATTFKRETGVSPARYRQKVRRD